MRIIKKAIQKILANVGYEIHRIWQGNTTWQGKPNPIRLWEDDSCFTELMRQIKGYTLVDEVRCFMIYQLARQVIESFGNVAEIGVYRGGTAKLLAKIFEGKNKTVYLFDTFSGMPASDPSRDFNKQKDYNDTSLKSVKTFMHDCKNVHFYEGLFPVTAKPIEGMTFCLVHIDADIYKSVKDCCVFFYPRMEKGGIMIFDDYGCLFCPGAKMAVDEFFLDKPEKPTYLPTGQCFVVRL
jgi:O-methyltransferase